MVVSVLLQVLNAQCQIACIYENYDGGFYKNSYCICTTELDYKTLVSKKLKKYKNVKQEDDQ